jgi:hypothetical protein
VVGNPLIMKEMVALSRNSKERAFYAAFLTC